MKKILIIAGLMCVCLNIFGQFSEDFLDGEKYGWNTREKYYRAREDKIFRQILLQIYDLKKQKVLDNALKSTVLPGWGQMTANSYTKGQILMGSELFLLGSFLYYQDKYQTEYDNYKKATYIADIEKHYDRANEHYTTSRAIIGLAAAIWLYGIFDSVLTTTDYNQKIWDDLYKDHQRKKITVSLTGITYRF